MSGSSWERPRLQTSAVQLGVEVVIVVVDVLGVSDRVGVNLLVEDIDPTTEIGTQDSQDDHIEEVRLDLKVIVDLDVLLLVVVVPRLRDLLGNHCQACPLNASERSSDR